MPLPLAAGEKVQGLLKIMFLDTANKIHRITKETNFVEIELSKIFYIHEKGKHTENLRD